MSQCRTEMFFGAFSPSRGQVQMKTGGVIDISTTYQVHLIPLLRNSLEVWRVEGRVSMLERTPRHTCPRRGFESSSQHLVYPSVSAFIIVSKVVILKPTFGSAYGFEKIKRKNMNP